MRLRKLTLAAMAALALGSAPLALAACDDDDSIGDRVEEAGEELGDEIDDHTDD